jgi:hypothetical protein
LPDGAIEANLLSDGFASGIELAGQRGVYQNRMPIGGRPEIRDKKPAENDIPRSGGYRGIGSRRSRAEP